MKCTKAQDLYFASRDALLDETGRLRLAEHLAGCPACALFVKEMEASLSMLPELPQLAPSDGFEWNVKRRIHAERAKLMRGGRRTPLGEHRWMPRFAIGAAAAAAAVVLVAVFAMGRFTAPQPSVRRMASGDRASAPVSAPAVDQGALDYTLSGGYAGPRMVSDNVISVGRTPEGAEQSPFQFVAASREDSLMRENELLRRRIANLERQMMYLQSVIERERAQRLNLSLP